MSDEKMVATDNVTDDAPRLVVMTDEPATAQQVESIVQITTMAEAANLLNLEDGYDVTNLLTSFEHEIHAAIDNKKTRMLKPLTDAKNILLRHEVEQMIEADGKFSFEGIIPFETGCLSCRGTGELYKFFRQAVTEPCNKCEDGRALIPCRSCKGTTRYRKKQGNLHINVDCTRCAKDSEGNPMGKEYVKCRHCRGTGNYRKLTIAPKIKSTTHCRECKGRGFTLPEPPPKVAKTPTVREADPDNPVLSADLASKLKNATVKE